MKRYLRPTSIRRVVVRYQMITERSFGQLRTKPTGGTYVALFNVADTAQTVEFPLQSLGAGKTSFHVRDLWGKRDLGESDRLKAELAPHASMLYRVK